MEELNKEILIGLGFKEVNDKDREVYIYTDNRVSKVYIELHKENKLHIVYTGENHLVDTVYGHCTYLYELVDILMNINYVKSVKLGRELKQQEIKVVLGL